MLSTIKETHLTVKDTYKSKVRVWEKIFHANGQDRKAGVAMLISEKNSLQKEGHKE